MFLVAFSCFSIKKVTFFYKKRLFGQELKQYPSLRKEVERAANQSLERMKNESRKATLMLVDMECCYLTADFFRNLPQELEKGGNPTQSIFDRYNEAYLRRIGELFVPLFYLIYLILRVLILGI